MSDRSKDDSHLPDGRKKTDKSLKDERAKADASLANGTRQMERQTDEAVLANRARADGYRLQARADVDVSTRSESGPAPVLDQSEAQALILQERRTADRALLIERRRMDSVLERERDQKKEIEEQLFQAERAETNRNLTQERHRTDVEVQSAQEDLLVEQKAHRLTLQALTTRDEFLAIVSHDLRNPLSSISMAADLMLESAAFDSLDEEMQLCAETIVRNAGEALRLISDLMDMESLMSGRLGLELARSDLTEIAEHSLATFAKLAAAKNLSLSFDKGEAGPVVALCDRDRVAQVLSNLLGNAIKFTPTGGSIGVSVSAADDGMRLAVRDSGMGIAENMREKIFDRFWQIGKPDRRGLGLGLYISRMIVEAQGGRIWVESRVGKGSTFHVQLPTG